MNKIDEFGRFALALAGAVVLGITAPSTLHAGAPDDCGSLEVESLEEHPAIPGSYVLTFRVTNLSGTAAATIRLLSADADGDGLPDCSFSPDSFSVPLSTGESTTLTTQVDGDMPACFELWLLDDDMDQCCVLLPCIGSTLIESDDFLRSDCNVDGTFDIADPVLTLGYLFEGSTTPCDDACDANDDGVVDVADAVFGLSTLFAEGPPPPAPYPDCGEDPSDDPLRCATGPGCG